jgi:hypothetical protein
MKNENEKPQQQQQQQHHVAITIGAGVWIHPASSACGSGVCLRE